MNDAKKKVSCLSHWSGIVSVFVLVTVSLYPKVSETEAENTLNRVPPISTVVWQLISFASHSVKFQLINRQHDILLVQGQTHVAPLGSAS